MRKDFFYAFLSFSKDKKVAFPYSNLNSKINSGSVLTKISRNKCRSKCKTQIHKNDFEKFDLIRILIEYSIMFMVLIAIVSSNST